MSLFSIDFEAIARLAYASTGLVLVAKWTLLLTLAWLAHAALAGRNPRWRVALWRGAMVGVGVVAALALVPPIVSYPVRPVLAEPRREVVERPRFEPTPPASVASRPEPSRIARSVAVALSSRVGLGSGRPPSSHAAETVPTASPAPAPRAAVAKAIHLMISLAPWIWLAGALIMIARLILAGLALARLVRRSEDASGAIAQECRAIAEHLGCTRAVRVVHSAEVATPCLAGLMRPVLLLPGREAEEDEVRKVDLRGILAHELAHARHHDLTWNLAAHLVTIGLWFHPLAWRIRAAHAAACDAVSDAVAADFLGDVASYGRTLARLALQAAGPAPVHGLAMARTSEVWRRLDALNRKVFRSPLAQRSALPALAIGGALLVLIGGFGVTQAQQEATPPPKASPAEPPAKGGRLVLRAVAAVSDEPIDGVSIQYRGRFDGQSRGGNVMTGEDGTATIEWDAPAKVDQLWITARKPKLVPIHILWSGEAHPIRLPETKELRFEPGTTVGGIIKDQDGRPVEGATVEIFSMATESDMAHYGFTLATLRTDAQGRWRVDEAPRGSAGISASVTHPRYRRGYAPASRDLDTVTMLTHGISVSGRVVDGQGRPIRGAEAVLGHDRWGTNPPTAKSNERGEFTLENCDAGPNMITVQADGFSPQIRDVGVAQGAGPVEIRMTEPAATIRVRVVDVAGKPVAGAFFAADTWRGHRSIWYRGNTDKDGRFEWRDAPRDVVLYDIGKEGYMSSRNVPLTASDREQTVILHPKLVVSGRVTDAANGRPVDRFRVVQGRRFEGQDRINWAENEGADSSGGRFLSRFDEPSAALFVRVEAPGYRPTDSRPFRPDEGSQTFDFALQPEAGLTGVVQLPDGRPVPGAEVALSTRENHISLRSGRFDRQANVPRTTTDTEGRFALARPDDKFLLIAVSDAGFADASSDEFAKSGKLVLQAWGRIDGGVRIGARAVAGQEVSFHPTRPNRGGGIYVFDYGYTTTTDERGRFAFGRVIPGPGTVSRVVITQFAGGRSSHMPGWQEPVDVKPGGTAQVKIGGRGRPVIGRVVLDGESESPVDWTLSEPATITTPAKEWNQAGRGYIRFGANIDRDGRFRIEDVPAGRYELRIDVHTAPGPARFGEGVDIGQLILPITVPEVPGGRSNEPTDLGTVTAKLFETLKAGDLAPDFTARRLDARDPGARLKLSDFQGKLILIDFWATWSGPRLAEMPTLKGIQDAFGGDPRFRLVNVSCDQSPEVAEEYLRRNPMNWAQAYVGDLQSSVAASYKLRAIPATFLIGPDGRILAKNLNGPALKEAIAGALKDESLFKAKARTNRPGRFPVTRFETAANAPVQGSADRPLVFVLDDCDEDFEEDRPHRDMLRILRAAGGGDKSEVVTSTFPEFNVCQTVGGIHGVAMDRERGRIYLSEEVARRVTALDFQGHKLWQIGNVDGGALAVDPRTGHVWYTFGSTLDSGETVVLDASGREVASFPVRGIDIAYDPHTDGFWLVGYGITKLSREGKVLFHKPKEGWACASVAVAPRDGSVWIVERDHPDVPRSANRLWHLDSGGGVIKMWPLGKKNPFGVAYDPNSGAAWVTCFRSGILRFTADGRELPALPIKAVAVAVSPTTGRVWATTETEIIGLDAEGRPAIRSPLGPKSGQSWLAAY